MFLRFVVGVWWWCSSGGWDHDCRFCCCCCCIIIIVVVVVLLLVFFGSSVRQKTGVQIANACGRSGNKIYIEHIDTLSLRF